MQPLIAQLPEVGTGKSQSPTTNILLRSVYTRNYATENLINAYKYTHNIREFWGQNFSTFNKLDTFCDFLRFLKRHFKKKVKSRVFLNLKKTKTRMCGKAQPDGRPAVELNETLVLLSLIVAKVHLQRHF